MADSSTKANEPRGPVGAGVGGGEAPSPAGPAKAPPPAAALAHAGPDEVSVLRWAALYAVFLVLAVAALVAMLRQHPSEWSAWAEQVRLLGRRPHDWSAWWRQFQQTFIATDPAIKLLAMAVYLSLATTFFPLTTGWLIACMATREAAVAGDVWGTTLAVGLVAAAASTLANLNDYHLFTWMLRHHRIGRLRQTQLHGKAARWFAKSPFLILVIFNIAPLPVDVIRILAASCRYPRGRFAGANLVGRFVRYAVIAFVTYWWNLGWIAVVTLLGLAVAMGLWKMAVSLARRVLGRGREPSTRAGV
jgi:membrane protein YqaA with SNARE-associated domain